MKRIIYSIWADVQLHQSSPQKKKDAFAQYKSKLIASQKKYAHFCGADYHCFSPSIPDYDDLQFEKLYRFEELSEEYDEIVYLDLDVIPTTKQNIFDRHAAHSAVGVHFINAEPYWKERIDGSWWVDVIQLDKMNMVVKTCCKNAMLMLEGNAGNNSIANTGVLVGNKNSIQNFKLIERLESVQPYFEEALTDNIYPEKIASKFERNNEVYFSFIQEFYEIPINPIGLGWNYIIDETFTTKQIGANLHHVVNKKFDLFTDYL
jgi:hypothetical protein